MTPADTKVGIVGVGHMGVGIATCLQRAGHPLVLLGRPGNQDTTALREGGATLMTDRDRLADASDVVLMVVTGAPQVEEVALGEGGVVVAMREGALLIDHSTSLPETSRKVAEACGARRVRFLDAPMTRTPKEAREGRLNLIVGGPQDAFAAARPLFDRYAENVAHVGGVGAGHAMKLLHNYVSLGFSAVMAEAAACARRMGIEADAFLDVVGKGGGGGVIFDRLAPYLRDGDGSGFTFANANAAKDLGYYLGMAQGAGARAGMAGAVESLYAEARDRDGFETVPTLIDLLSE